MSKEAKTGNWFSRHKILTGIGGLIIIGIIASAAGGSKSNTPTKTATTNNSQKTVTTQMIGLNQAANDGKFEFTVASITCNIPTVSDGSGYLTKTAQGQYCVLDMSVKNIGNQAQTLDSSSQYLYNASGQKYSADATASLYDNPSGSTFLDSINPGNAATGKFVFDIPKDQTPVTAELHDSSFSGGVKVKLQ